MIYHQPSSTYPFKCKVCGKENIEILMILFYYKDEGWLSLNYCSEKCFSKLDIPYLVGKTRGNLINRIKGYRFYKEIQHNGLKYIYPAKEFKIDNGVEIDPYKVFGCK